MVMCSSCEDLKADNNDIFSVPRHASINTSRSMDAFGYTLRSYA